MSGLRHDRILASTALAIVLAAPLGGAQAQGIQITGQVKAYAAVPVPGPKPATVERAPGEDAAGAVKQAPASPAAATPIQQPATPAAPAAAPSAPAQPAVAAEPATAAPDPLASLDPADRAIAEKLRDLLAAKSDRIFATRKERAAVEAFYQNRNLAPIWFDKGVEAPRAKAAIARLKAADADGLEPADYKAPNFAGLATAEAQAEAELKLTQVILTYARHAQAGRFPYQRVSQNNIELPQQPPDAADVLTRVTDATDVAKTLDEFNPQNPYFQKLKAALAEMRAKSHSSTREEIPDGAVLKFVNKSVMMEDSRVPMLRKRLGIAGDTSDLKYDAKLAEAVKRFQKANDLPTTGQLDSRTVRELNGPAKGQQIDIILANMERWRWYPRDLGAAYSMVNHPDFTLRVMKNEQMLWTTRVVIGLPSKSTPLLTETMKYITVNPTWNVPPSIVQNEYLPALQQDPTVLARMGLRVSYDRDGSVHISQPPGEANALGRLRFNFPNRFLVYQHDTPDKHLFAHESRAYSHGCMRVQDPAKYAEVMLGLGKPEDGYTAERIKRMFGTAETDIHFTTPIPVHLTYQTAFVDDDGKLQFRRDVYGLDARTIAAIKSERAMIDPKEERAKEREMVANSARRSVQLSPFQRGGAFLSQWFGGFGPGYRPTPPRRVTR